MSKDEILMALEKMDENPFDVDAILAAHQNRDAAFQDPALLKRAVQCFLNEHYSFKPFDFVQWKPGMRIRQSPDCCMNAYARADARDQEIQEQMHLDDLRMEAAIDDVLSRTDTLRVALGSHDWEEESIALRRFVGALFTLYHDTKSMTPNVMRLRGAMYALVKQHCREPS